MDNPDIRGLNWIHFFSYVFPLFEYFSLRSDFVIFPINRIRVFIWKCLWNSAIICCSTNGRFFFWSLSMSLNSDIYAGQTAYFCTLGFQFSNDIMCGGRLSLVTANYLSTSGKFGTAIATHNHGIVFFKVWNLTLSLSIWNQHPLSEGGLNFWTLDAKPKQLVSHHMDTSDTRYALFLDFTSLLETNVKGLLKLKKAKTTSVKHVLIIWKRFYWHVDYRLAFLVFLSSKICLITLNDFVRVQCLNRNCLFQSFK